MDTNISTPFSVVYESFLSKVTDDMYMELDRAETEKMMEELLLSAIPWFEFPRVNLFDFEPSYIISEETYNGVDSDYMDVQAIVSNEATFNVLLDREEINILATYMVVEWVGQQLASVENVRMKYSGSDFKFTSQANHIHKLIQLKKEYLERGFHLQRVYKRRALNSKDYVVPTLGTIMDAPEEGQVYGD